jgi:hypothetical protein
LFHARCVCLKTKGNLSIAFPDALDNKEVMITLSASLCVVVRLRFSGASAPFPPYALIAWNLGTEICDYSGSLLFLNLRFSHI